jgi:hypothetical protein
MINVRIIYYMLKLPKVKAEIRKISSGEYTVGQQIAPRKVSAKQYYFTSLL